MSPILWNPISSKSSGGTELLARRLEAELLNHPELASQVQIVPSRLYGQLDESKARVFWAHDLPGDPESNKVLDNQGWRRFHVLVFVSNFQMQQYVARYGLPWSRCVVIPNSIEPLEKADLSLAEDDQVRFIYHTTPHRGLELLYPVFDAVSKVHKNVHLDVYSSFDIYGWGERDRQYKNLFESIKSHEAMTYHGSVSNDEVRRAISGSHAFVYPSVWCETSCLALMEAMSAGLVCVHSNYGALYETSANWTQMYQFREDPQEHMAILHANVEHFLANRTNPEVSVKSQNQSSYADIFYNWNLRKHSWIELIKGILPLPRNFEMPKIRL